VKIKMAQLVGKIMRNNAEVITIFKVDGKYYPATGENAELFETYLHTGEEFWLSRLENELEVE
jgi:hypothetical protein